jgi:hypothetical protein
MPSHTSRAARAARAAGSGPATLAFDPRFVERSALFWPVARAARAVCGAPGDGADGGGFPRVEALDRVFVGALDGAAPPVRFVLSAPRSRPRRGRRGEGRPPIELRELYDARITLDRVVPTRRDSWHDLMNALVWGTFPRAKLALHARQHRAIAERIAPGACTLPPTRTRELDALALLDEGGVVLTGVDGRCPVVFGHAIYESLARGIPAAIVAAIRLDVAGDAGEADGSGARAVPGAAGADGAPHGDRTEADEADEADKADEADEGMSAAIRAIDGALARCIEDPARLRSPEDLSRAELPGARAPSIRDGGWATSLAPRGDGRPR